MKTTFLVRLNMKKIVLTFIVIFILIQFIPYGRDHINPKVVAEPKWDSPQTRKLFMRACADCHSHEVKWPFYSYVAPISWLVQHDVDEGREHFNISMWGVQKKNDGDESSEEFREGEMAPWFYLMVHPEAKFSKTEKAQFIKGLVATFGEKDKEDEH